MEAFIQNVRIDDPSIELVAINEVNPDLNNWAYTLNYDSIYSQSKHKASIKNDKLICNKKKSPTSINKDIEKFDGKNGEQKSLLISTGVLENTLKGKRNY